MLQRIFSGIQPTGRPHLGNYLGAMRQHVALSKDTAIESYFCVVDYHALTTIHDADALRTYTRGVILDYLALGMDYHNATLFVQSAVPEHTELSWILSNFLPVSRLAKVPTFKEKKAERPDDVNFGLMSYAVLMAADILMYGTTHVPVGIDQVPHIEITRDLAKSFNAVHGEIFAIPEALLHKGTEKILGTDGVKKMSKSVGNTIEIFASPEETAKKVSSMVTDPLKIKKTDPGRPETCNVYSFHKLFSPAENLSTICEGCKDGTLGCVADKQALAQAINDSLSSFREKREELEAKPKNVDAIIAEGNKKAKDYATKMMTKVRKAVGLA